MKLEWLAGVDYCGKEGICPTIWRKAPGTVTVQGPATDTTISLPPGELAVDLPDDVILHAADEIRRRL